LGGANIAFVGAVTTGVYASITGTDVNFTIGLNGPYAATTLSVFYLTKAPCINGADAATVDLRSGV